MKIRNLLSVRLGERRWTRKQLARKTGIRANTIGELYSGVSTAISFENLALICEALECDITDIFVLTDGKDDLTNRKDIK